MHLVSCPGVPQRAVVNLGVLVLGDGLLSLFSCVCVVMYLSICGFVHECRCPRPDVLGFFSPEAGVTDDREPPDVGAGN